MQNYSLVYISSFKIMVSSHSFVLVIFVVVYISLCFTPVCKILFMDQKPSMDAGRAEVAEGD